MLLQRITGYSGPLRTEVNYSLTRFHVSLYKWVPDRHDMARSYVSDGGDGLQIWRVAAIVLNKQSRTADKGWSTNLDEGSEFNNSLP
jgi:hypothetical protein